MDHIYIINLPQRKNRRRCLQHLLDEWGIDAEFFEAVDGKILTAEDVAKYEMKKCKDYRHYSTGRDLTYGEVSLHSAVITFVVTGYAKEFRHQNSFHLSDRLETDDFNHFHPGGLFPISLSHLGGCSEKGF